MIEEVEKEKLPKKNRQRGKYRKIGFAQEVVTKDVAKTLLSEVNNAHSTKESFLTTLNAEISEAKSLNVKRKKEKKHKTKLDELPSTIGNDDPKESESNKKLTNINDEISNSLTEEPQDSVISKSKKRKRNRGAQSISTDEVQEEKTEENTTEKKETISKRSLKKIKHQKLLDDKKIKIDTVLQQKALTYLSNWKHDRSNWKFEKLRQIWLLQNLYDSTKIEDKFWDTVVEYFSSSKGKVHKTILDEAIKIVENEGEAIDEKANSKLKRARDIVQNLDE